MIASPSSEQQKLAKTLESIASSVFERVILARRVLESPDWRLARLFPAKSALEKVLTEIEEENAWGEFREAFRLLHGGISEVPRHHFNLARLALGQAATKVIRFEQYLGLLPSPTVPQAMQMALELSFPTLFPQVCPVVLPLPDLDYYEFDLADIISKDDIFANVEVPPNSKIIRISIIDAFSPLSWSVMPHEFGHTLLQERGAKENIEKLIKADAILGRLCDDTYEMSGQLIRTGEVFVAHCIDLVADAIALRAFGPAAILALIRFELLTMSFEGRAPQATSRHASSLARIAFARTILGEEALTPFTNLLNDYKNAAQVLIDIHCNNQKITEAEKKYNEIYYPVLSRIARDVATQLCDMTFERKSMERADRLLSRLKRNLPPSAIRYLSKAKIRPQFERAIYHRDIEEFKSCRDLLREKPALPLEVLASGFLLRDQVFAGLVRSTILSTGAPNWGEWLERLVVFLANSDELLRSALETADIHSAIVGQAEFKLNYPRDVYSEPRARTNRHGISGHIDTPHRSNHDNLLGDSEIVHRLLARNDDRRIYVTPLIDPKKQVGPASLDLRFGAEAIIIRNSEITCIDLAKDEKQFEKDVSLLTSRHRITPANPLVLHPGEFALARTLEYVRLPQDIAARLEGRSSIGRIGLLVHATAGFIDPGFSGFITYELYNCGKLPIKLYPGARIAQLCFFRSSGTIVSYSSKGESKYDGALESQASRLYQDDEYSWFRQLNASR